MIIREEYLKRIRPIVNIFSSFKYRLNKNRSAWVLKSELCHQS
jgi:hypothetical protein